MEEKLKDIYFNPRTGYGGMNDLARKAGVSAKKAYEFLHQQDVYTLHKPIRKRFPRRKVYVHGIDQQWQADLVDMKRPEFGKINHPYYYILTVIDCFSKFAWAIALKDKTGAEIVKALEKIFESGRKPLKIQTDAGTEFYNSKVKKLFKSINNIELFSTDSDLKASIVERFNRTLKDKMWKVFSQQNSYKWISVLQDLVTNYNNSYHRSIKMSPIKASKPENSSIVQRNLYPEKVVKPLNLVPKFKIGDKIRISKYKTVFDKGYLPNWTTEIFVIDEVLQTNPITYKIKDLADEEITGSFYEQDLVKFDKKDDVYKIEKIIRRRTNKTTGNKEIFVKWYDYPTVFNSWVPESVLV